MPIEKQPDDASGLNRRLATPINREQAGNRQSVDVSAGLIFRGGKLLIAQRHADSHLGGLWEFPGGKREPGETFEQCLQRELREELGVEVSVGDLLEHLIHDYAERTVCLKFFVCQLERGEPQPVGCAAVKWIDREQLVAHEFPAADARLIRRLRQPSFKHWFAQPGQAEA